MKLLIDIGHPAHVHFFKNFIWEMQKRNHTILITAREKEISIKLLEIYMFNFTKISKMKKGRLNCILECLPRDVNLLKISLKFKPDIMFGIGGTCLTHVSKITQIPSIIFTDYPLWYDKILTYPFANLILTPQSFSKDLGNKQLKFEGYKELAYLHPIFFKPDTSIYDRLGIDKKEKYILMRFASFDAAHDSTAFGFNESIKLELVNELKKYAKIFIIPAGSLPNELEEYKIKIPIDEIHNALYFAELLISDSQTMTTEAAVLGTPVVRYNSWVGSNDAINFIELEKKYNLIFNFNKPEFVLDKCRVLLNNPTLKNNWKLKKDEMLKDKINVTNFLIWLVENFKKDKFVMMQDYYLKYLEECH